MRVHWIFCFCIIFVNICGKTNIRHFANSRTVLLIISSDTLSSVWLWHLNTHSIIYSRTRWTVPLTSSTSKYTRVIERRHCFAFVYKNTSGLQAFCLFLWGQTLQVTHSIVCMSGDWVVIWRFCIIFQGFNYNRLEISAVLTQISQEYYFQAHFFLSQQIITMNDTEKCNNFQHFTKREFFRKFQD